LERIDRSLGRAFAPSWLELSRLAAWEKAICRTIQAPLFGMKAIFISVTDRCQAASDAFMTSQFTRRWKLSLAPAITLAPILPVPVFAPYSLGTCTPSTPSGLTPWGANGSSGFDLSITAQGGGPVSTATIDFTAPITYIPTPPPPQTITDITATNLSNFDAIHNISTFGTGTKGLQITIGFIDSNGNLVATIFQNSNQFTA